MLSSDGQDKVKRPYISSTSPKLIELGLNLEQRRRLTIAVELAAQPSDILFLGTYVTQQDHYPNKS